MNTSDTLSQPEASLRLPHSEISKAESVAMDQEQEAEILISSQDNSDSCCVVTDVQPDANGNNSSTKISLRGVKRSASSYSDDEEASLSKYKKLSTEQKIIEGHISLDSSLSTDEISDDSSVENLNQKKKSIRNDESTSENSSSSDDSVEISLQDKTLNDDDLSKENRNPNEAIEKYVLPTTVSNSQLIIHTSQFSLDTNLGELNTQKYTGNNGNDSNTIVLDESTNISDIDTQKLNTEETNESNSFANKTPELNFVNEVIPSVSDIDTQKLNTEEMNESNSFVNKTPELNFVNEVIPSGLSSETRTNGSGNETDIQNIQNMILSSEVVVSTQDSDKNTAFVLQNSDSDRMHCKDIPQISIPDDVEGNNTIKLNRAASVSDLNLAQLILSLKEDIQDLTKKVEKQENILATVVHANEINLAPLFAQSFPEKYNLKLPFSTIEEFDKFNQDLIKDRKFCNEFITSLCSFIDNNVPFTKNIMTMLRKYMSKDLAMLYTASKSTGSKMVLKDTLFCKCLLQATKLTIRNGLLPLEHEKAFLKSLGIVVSGARNWPTQEEEKKHIFQL